MRAAVVRFDVVVAARGFVDSPGGLRHCQRAGVPPYWRDKHKARADQWRIPENVLHALELAGGWPGALLAQQVFRHKTRKLSFQLVFWIIVLLHQVFWIDRLFLGAQLFTLF